MVVNFVVGLAAVFCFGAAVEQESLLWAIFGLSSLIFWFMCRFEAFAKEFLQKYSRYEHDKRREMIHPGVIRAEIHEEHFGDFDPDTWRRRDHSLSN